ncbi:MAG: DUF2281 domain-containing protein [Tannerellaceae bacterium]|jgi:hypothetical protein|nr:DUF2281 domain-containing protein [Tannerellaceae bacterium]
MACAPSGRRKPGACHTQAVDLCYCSKAFSLYLPLFFLPIQTIPRPIYIRVCVGFGNLFFFFHSNHALEIVINELHVHLPNKKIVSLQQKNIMSDTLIYRKIKTLTPDLRKEVLDFIEFILTKQEQSKTKRTPVFGCAKGQFQMTNDFDAPLDDFKEYMQ